MRTPRACSHWRSAPATTVSTTSLTVPPNAFLTALKSPSSDTTPAKRRCGPIATFSGVGGAGFRPAQTISPTPSAATRASASARSGARSAASAFAVTASDAFAIPAAPALSSDDGVRVGLGDPRVEVARRSASARARGRTGPSRGRRRRCRRSSRGGSSSAAPKLPSSRPSMSHISHSGLERSSCCEKTRATRFMSCSWLPGAGSAVWRTWYSRLKSVSSVHSGRPGVRPAGTRGAGGSAAPCAGAGGSSRGSRRTPGSVPRRRTSAPMCMCDSGPSWCRNDASIAVSRSRWRVGMARRLPSRTYPLVAWRGTSAPSPPFRPSSTGWRGSCARRSGRSRRSTSAGRSSTARCARCRSRSRSVGCGPPTCRRSSAARASARCGSGSCTRSSARRRWRRARSAARRPTRATPSCSRWPGRRSRRSAGCTRCSPATCARRSR